MLARRQNSTVITAYTRSSSVRSTEFSGLVLKQFAHSHTLGQERRVVAMEGGYSILGFPEVHDPDVVYLENQAGSIYVEEAGETERYSQMFNHLLAKALSPDDSARLIREVAKSF